MPLFETFQINLDELKETVFNTWGVEIDKCIKSSQNHTYLAIRKDDQKQFILRITPDPKHTDREASIELEVQFLHYLDEHHLPVCVPVKKLTNTVNGSSDYILKSDNNNTNLLVVLFTFAEGDPIVYQDWKWMTSKEIVVGLGRWIKQFHKLSKQYSSTSSNSQLVQSARHWRKLHNGVLESVQIDERDEATSKDPNCFGIIHGDINPSNYFWNDLIKLPTMFDWDQLQSSWFLYDLSSPIWGVVVLEKSGSPIDGKPVPEASISKYTNWLLEGYEEGGENKVDREALQRMVLIRRELYVRFCKQAIGELEESHPMYKFCKTMVDIFESNKDI